MGHALASLGFTPLKSTRIGKLIELEVEAQDTPRIPHPPGPGLPRPAEQPHHRGLSLRNRAPMNIAVLQFPGSNCDQDAFHIFASGLRPSDPLCLAQGHGPGRRGPGRRPGRLLLWRLSALRRDRAVFARHGRRAGFCRPRRPGVRHLQRFPDPVRGGAPARGADPQLLARVPLHHVRIEGRGQHGLFLPRRLGATIRVPIAHGEGNYRIDEAGLARLEANRQILLRYVRNPNGSIAGIAGIRNEEGNVFGMMPHPERAFERFHPSRDGLAVARAVLAARFRSFREIRRPAVPVRFLDSSSLTMPTAESQPAPTARDRFPPLPPNPDPILNQAVTAELVRKHGLLPDEYELHPGQPGPRADPHGTGNILGDVVGALLVQEQPEAAQGLSRPKRCGRRKDFGRVLVKAGEENAGIIDVGEGWAVAFKIESHNHPSAVEPFEGAATGVGGIIRDIFTMGARPGPAHQFAALRGSGVAGDEASPARRRGRDRALRKLRGGPDRRRRRLFRPELRGKSPGQRAMPRRPAPRPDPAREGHRASATRSTM